MPDALPTTSAFEKLTVNVIFKEHVSSEVVASTGHPKNCSGELWTHKLTVNVIFKERVSSEVVASTIQKIALENSELTQRVAIAEQRIEMLGREL